MKKKVLIAEDENYLRVLLQQILEDTEYEIVGEAKNGREAVVMYKGYKPDLVLMDIMMPGVSGIQALKDIRKHDPEAKVIMLTATADSQVAKDAIQSGAKDYVIKPFTEERLLGSMKKVLG